jgi:Mycobacterium membrane protein
VHWVTGVNKVKEVNDGRGAVDYAGLDVDYEDFADDYQDYDDFGTAGYRTYSEPDLRWRWVAGVAAAVLLVAVIATAVVVGGGDSTSTGTTVSPPPTRTVVATPVPPLSLSPPPALPPETVVTLSPSTTPAPTPEATAPAEPAPPDPRTVTYTVTGNRQLFDLVTIIYTDEQGLPRTDINVALPWTKTLVLNPGVETTSVTAASVAGQLNCTITDAGGATIVAQTNNMMIATCTR